MSARSVVVILLALICGIAAAVGVTMRQPSNEGVVETAPILVIKQNVPRGRMVTADMLELKDWPKNFLPANVLTDPEQAVGRAIISPFLAGEPVLEGKLASRDSGRGLAALVPKGMRAYTVQTSRVAATVAGFILPGNRVDVLMSMHGSHNDGSGGGSTTTLLQAVEILAVDQRLDAPAENKIDPSDKGSVTLLVTPEQASLLDLGQSIGALTLSLRNLDDTDQSATRTATLAELRTMQDKMKTAADPAPPKPVKVAPDISVIRTLRGRHSSKIVLAR